MQAWVSSGTGVPPVGWLFRKRTGETPVPLTNPVTSDSAFLRFGIRHYRRHAVGRQIDSFCRHLWHGDGIDGRGNAGKGFPGLGIGPEHLSADVHVSG